MNNIWWQTKGQGNVHLVLLHGWGLNAEVWRCIDEELSSHFTLHLVDLPGFGRSRGFGAMSLADMAEAVLRQAPDKAIWLGWSLGGLVASQIALTHPERVQALVTVASSPCFSARDEWSGIKPDVLAGFQQQLSEDFQRTVERFLALQTMGTETARQDARALKKTVLALPMPEVDVLNGGLEILKTVDLRQLGGVIDEKAHFLAVFFGKMLLRHLKGFVYTLADGNAGHDHDELTPTIGTVQLVHGLDIGIGLADAGFHLDGQVIATFQVRGRLELIRPLHLPQILQYDVVGKLRHNLVVAPAGEILFIDQRLPIIAVASVHHVGRSQIRLSSKDVHHGPCCISLKFLMLKS